MQQRDERKRDTEADVDAGVTGADGHLDAAAEERSLGKLMAQPEAEPVQERLQHAHRLDKPNGRPRDGGLPSVSGWSGWRDSNPRPLGPEPSALPS